MEAFLNIAGAFVCGEALISPTEIVERTDSVILSITVTFFAATMGINRVANLIPSVNGIANLAPGLIGAAFGGLFSRQIAIGGLEVCAGIQEPPSAAGVGRAKRYA